MSNSTLARPPRRAWTARALLLLLSLLAMGALSRLPTVAHEGRLLSWQTLLPPFVALAAVVVSRAVIPALSLALVVASLLGRSPLEGLVYGLDKFVWSNISDPWHLCVTGFVVSVLVTVKLAEASGGTLAVVQKSERYLRSARSVRLGSFALGILVFFDDYANTMLVGPSMRPLADRYRVSREKLAYIVDSTAAPIAGLAVVSTWLGYEVGLLEENTLSFGLSDGGYALLLQALPLRFYCIFALIMVLLNAALGRDFGPMLRAERLAHRSPLATPSESAQNAHSDARKGQRLWLNSALPMAVLLVSVAVGLFYDGGGFSRLWLSADPTSLQFWRQTLGAVDNSEKVLLSAGILGLLTAVLTTLSTQALTRKSLLKAMRAGLGTATMPLGILICAWGLGVACKDLGTGNYLLVQLAGSLPTALIPVTTFIAAALVAAATGTSWGTMAIVIPAAVPLAYGMGGLPVLIATIAAVLDGAIFGDHCSPISDTTLLSSTATECDVLQHVWTQLPYALVAMACAALSYLAVAFGTSLWLIYPTGIFALLLTLGVVGRRANV